MSTHLYCLFPQSARWSMPANVIGIDGAAVRTLVVESVAAWVSDATAVAEKLSIEAVRAHDAVIQQALDSGLTPAPARFGQRFADDSACVAALEPLDRDIGRMLANVQGFVEMTLILTPSTNTMLRDLQPVVPTMLTHEPGAGRRYLETLRTRNAAAENVRQGMEPLAQRLSAAVERLVSRAAGYERSMPTAVRALSHLVARDDIESYRAAVEGVGTVRGYRCIMVGPRAPYSFCAVGPGDDGQGIQVTD